MNDERMFRLDHKAALVVGAGSGIGQAIAEAFAAVWAQVGCVDIAAEAAQKVAEGINSDGGHAVGIACDVSDEASVADAVSSFVEAFGALRILVNGAAGHDRTGTILDLPPDE